MQHASSSIFGRTLLLFCVLLFAACTNEVSSTTTSIHIAGIAHTTERIVPNAPLPVFQNSFAAGTTAVHTYVFFDGIETAPQGFVATMEWYSATNNSPAINHHTIPVPAGQNTAAFTLENADGLPAGTYRVIVHAGPTKEQYTTSDSASFTVGTAGQDA